MKIFSYTILILIIFIKTGNVLSKESIFNVNNIKLVKKYTTSNQEMANQAIKMGFEQLKKKILLKTDLKKLSKLSFLEIKELVSYYQVQNLNNNLKNQEEFNYNILFDKDKLHNLFYINNIAYAEITNKEIFLLPIYLKDNEINVYNNNYFYNNWSLNSENKFVEFILPLENIETLQKINSQKNDLFNLDLKNLYPEYNGKNLALVFIEDNNSKSEKIFLKTKFLEKNIDKSLSIKRSSLNQEEFYLKIIKVVNEELISLLKLQNLIYIKTPSFLNTKFKVNTKNNLVDLKERIKKIDLIDQVYVQKFNKDFIILKIKYMGKLDKIIKQLEKQKIFLRLNGDEWSIKLV